MSPKVPPRDQIDAWLAQAERDLEIAAGNLNIGFADACALYSQQAAEKFLKALYMLKERAEAPKTHEIVGLAAQLGVPEDVADGLDLVEKDALAPLYPDVMVKIGPPEYNAAVGQARLATARGVAAWVRSQTGERHTD